MSEPLFSKQGIVLVLTGGKIVNASPSELVDTAPIVHRRLDPATVYPMWDIDGNLSVRVVDDTS